MAPAGLDTEQEVYLALRGIFTGQHAQLREKKFIRALIKRHLEGDIDLLVKKHTLEKVVRVVRLLLVDEVFEIESKARERFPGAFDDAVVSNADETSEQLSTVSGMSEQAPACQHCGSAAIVIVDGIRHQEAVNTDGHFSSRPAEGAPPHERLFPIFLPFETQYAIMSELRRTLECVCFAYGQQFLKSLLESRRWTCAVAVELKRWADVFQQRIELLLTSSPRAVTGDYVRNLLKSMSHIQEVSDRRIDIPATRLEQYIQDAQKLVDILQSHATAEALGRLRDTVRAEVERLEKERTSLLEKFASLQQDIASERRALDQKEEKAVASVEEQDAGYLKRAGEGIQNAVFDYQLTKPIVPAVESSDKAVDDHDADIVVC